MNTTTIRTTRTLGQAFTMAALVAAAVLSASAAHAATPFRVTTIDIKPGLDNIRGPIAAGRFAPDTGKAASCPVRFTGAVEAGKFVCSRQVVQLSDVKCPSNFPNYVARNSASSGLGDRDVCAAPGRNLPTQGSLAGLRDGVDFVKVPLNGVRNGVSFVSVQSNATPADGWRLNLNSSGVADRYRRVLELFADPVLVAR
ncbi:MAG: hypothetical protein IPM01_06105 [Burkholderiaceae bacterium]|nr:hypothetical protein [Burkholderiaceae bacterium]